MFSFLPIPLPTETIISAEVKSIPPASSWNGSSDSVRIIDTSKFTVQFRTAADPTSAFSEEKAAD